MNLRFMKQKMKFKSLMTSYKRPTKVFFCPKVVGKNSIGAETLQKCSTICKHDINSL